MVSGWLLPFEAPHRVPEGGAAPALRPDGPVRLKPLPLLQAQLDATTTTAAAAGVAVAEVY